MELVGAVARALAAATCRARLTGAQHLPRTGPALLMVNHTTIVDVAPVLASLAKSGLRLSLACRRSGCGTEHGHVRFLATELVFRHPIVGPLAKHAGFIRVGWQRPAPDALRDALSALERGEVVGIFPEGNVSANPDGSPRRFRSGLARLALDTGCPVVPLAHHDARLIGAGGVAESLRGAARSVVRRPEIRLHVGEPVQPAEYAGLPIGRVSELLRSSLIRTWRQVAHPADCVPETIGPR
ncbi:MAG: 1-acyl-sn-glycerol-3-phosphate acyltransferase [Sporichthyaceae bacterium]|nr:1-acyl-sn-glycerol-3-phosphate acyltransferase [Sporichthyaceae bacterium]